MIKEIQCFINFLKSKEIIIPIILGVLISVLSNQFNWDLRFQDLFWDTKLEQWTGKESAIAQLLYNYGVLPAILIPLFALLVLVLGYSLKALCPYRKIALYLFLVLAVGNGLLVNGLLKEYWGRPRPAQVIEYQGTQAFEPSLWLNLNSYGKSFPCGHATMGFYFFSIGLLFQKRIRRAIFTFALIFGLVIGIARSSMGGHFLTDTLWSAILMWIVAKGLYLKLKLNETLFYWERPPKSKNEEMRRKLIQLALVPLSLLFIFSVFLASPRDKTHTLIIPPIEKETLQLNLKMQGIVYLQSNSETFKIETHAVGFGLPKSKLITNYKLEPLDTLTLAHKVNGFFSELNANTHIYLPANKAFKIGALKPYPKRIYLNSVEIENLEATLLIK